MVGGGSPRWPCWPPHRASAEIPPREIRGGRTKMCPDGHK
nr:MAG TPA_asm: hypothetical protein [Caudoviricetes sp.]